MGAARPWPLRLARAALCAVIVVWTLFPIYYMLTLSFTPTSELFRPEYFVAHPTLESYRFIVFQESVFVKFFWRWMANSVVIAAATMLIVLAVSALGSFALGRIRFGGARFISGMTLFTYIIPASFLSIPFFKIIGDYNLLDSFWSVIAAMTTFASPYALWVLWDYSKTIPPEIDESAAIDGAGWWRRLFSITMPLLAPTFTLIFVLAAGVLGEAEVSLIFWGLDDAGPEGAGRIVGRYAYELAFRQGDLRWGYAAAMNLTVGLISIALSALIFRALRSGRV